MTDVDIRRNPFLNQPWMMERPGGAENYKKWVRGWTDAFLEIAEIQNIQLINKYDLRKMEPFNRLSDEDFEILVKEYLDSPYCTYWGGDKIRVYWRTLDTWADALHQAAKEKDKNIILGLETLGEFDARMATIPSTDQSKIMQILVDRNKARWVEKENNVLKIL
ncbi:hypothetical protein JXL21_09965 [Candidatus Bathyarchaeota archaeon]|nr:hypothetical protein [Candidatus Bathyarchaeota archaeon]